MKILLVGAGGYASGYVKTLLSCSDPELIFEGVVEPYYAACSTKETIDAANIPVYATMEDFYAEHSADLAVICTPPFLHREQSVFALSHGSYVLCEKPIAPTVEEAEQMLEAERHYGRFLAIGYQWSYSDAIQALKRDILNGVLGAPISLKTAISCPRKRAYYARGTGWGGKISKNGVMILDSIASNACAHYLHNMFFLLGASMETSAEVSDLRADCLRANDIENFDTCSIQMKISNGIPLYFIASHAAEKQKNPEFIYIFENAVVSFSEDDGSCIKAVFSDGSTKCYGDPFEQQFKKMFDCLEAIQSGTQPICTVKTALPHTKLVKRLYQGIPIQNFSKTLIGVNKETDGVFVQGLFGAMYDVYEKEALLSDVHPELLD